MAGHCKIRDLVAFSLWYKLTVSRSLNVSSCFTETSDDTGFNSCYTYAWHQKLLAQPFFLSLTPCDGPRSHQRNGQCASCLPLYQNETAFSTMYTSHVSTCSAVFMCLAHLLDVVSLLAGSNRNSYVVQGTDGPRPMAIFELLDYIVNEVCCVLWNTLGR